jgi:putative glutamine amidotransferase
VSQSNHPLIGIPAASLDPAPNPGALYFQFSGNYPAALAASGALPVIIPLGLPEEILRDLFERLDGLLLAGGVDVAPHEYGEAPHPKLGRVDATRDATELTVARWALAAALPILGICRGIQSLNVAAGGSLYQDLAAQFPNAVRHTFTPSESPWEQPTHHVDVTAGSRLASIFGVEHLAVNSFHHQAVKQPAPGFIPTARAEDGVVEGIEDPGRRFVVGVQWHPEGMFRSDPLARRLFAAFVDATKS